jgi:hypothetical protein
MSDPMILDCLIKFAIFDPAFAFINATVAKLTVIVAKNGSIIKQQKNTDLAGDLVGDIVAKNLCYGSKTDLARDIAGAKKNYAMVARQTSPKISPETL